ncbi:MAG: putative porin [Paucibacter sp.]|nr:putative porin [Roseateles sp.]
MKIRLTTRRPLFPTAFLAAVLTLTPLAARADDHEDLEKLRATVLNLIDTLIKSGLLPRDRADAMMKDAQRQATEQLAQTPPPEIGADGKKIVRVPYVPEAVRVQMREQIKAEVLAETRAAGGGGAAAAETSTGARLQLSGDLRLRSEDIRPASDNSPASVYSVGNPDFTRAPDFWANPNGNTQQAVKRTRERLRVGTEVAVADEVQVGLAVSTGSSTGSPTSTNQTMATGSGGSPGYFDKYSLVVDKAYLRYQPFSVLSFSGGRFANPFQATDLVWADDLNFEGFVTKLKGPTPGTAGSYVTAGWFPLGFSAPGQYRHRDLLALQLGTDWQYGLKENHLKLAAALYDYSHVEGVLQTTKLPAMQPGYLSSEYGSAYRQRGNTLFRINTNPLYDSSTNWGLASSFHEFDLTAVAEVAQFDPLHIVLTGDFVYNLGFDRKQIQNRTGLRVTDGSPYGYLVNLQVGAARIQGRGDWNAALGYRRLGSDAVIDAFTNSDFGGGGTNLKGFVLSANLGIAKNTWLTSRLLSAQSMDSAVPLIGQGTVSTKFSIDTLQLDLNSRF